ncbi:tautomerase family protein [Corynebacterium lubricantis]|uniref:tautomerase family protein n=1 Tax=Corynebacterium lubricantis TaxID=541095 RepID=UPI000382F223|nr:tautomerase family protein [Corynebacterium lubricantis]
MTLVRIDLPELIPVEQRGAIADTIYDALVTELGVPVGDKFVIVNAHKLENLVMDPTYLVRRSNRALIIQITLNEGRDVEQKKQFYRVLAEALQDAVGIRTEDVFINLVEVPKENWSFGGGEAQYAD